jgi:hypothetical protein
LLRTLLRLEKQGAKIFAVSESIIYRIAANWTLFKIGKKEKLSIKAWTSSWPE